MKESLAPQPKDQYEIWGFENLSGLIDSRNEEDNFEEVLEYARSIEDITPDQALQLASKLSKKYKKDVREVKMKLDTDPLTGLFSRRFFDRKFPSLIKKFDNPNTLLESAMLILGDIDHFKVFNDTHGHQAGDQVIKAVAKRLQESVREWGGDIICRWAGDEFGIVLVFTRHYDEKGELVIVDHEEIFERIKKKVNGDFFVSINGKDERIDISFGRAVFQKDKYQEAKREGKYSDANEVAEKLFADADADLYNSKKSRSRRAA